MKSFYTDGWGRGLNRRPLPQTPSSLDTMQAILSGKCANCRLSQPRGSPQKIVPKIVPSGHLDALSCKLGRSAEARVFTSESQHIQNALNC